MEKTAIIILTYNKLNEATRPCLESLYKNTDVELFDLYVVDNGSKDETIVFIEEYQKRYPNIKLIKNLQNEGYSKGNNIGLKEALKKDYKYIGLLNNDILFTPDWLNKTIEAFSLDEQLGALSPRNNEKTNLTAFNYLNSYKKYLSKFKTPIRYVVTPFFSCVIFKRRVLDEIGLFDENYSPAFFEDNDLSFRVLYKGYSLGYCNNTFIFHNHSTTSKNIDKSIFERNKEYFFKKHPLGKYIWEHKRTNVIKDIIKYLKDGKI